MIHVLIVLQAGGSSLYWWLVDMQQYTLVVFLEGVLACMAFRLLLRWILGINTIVRNQAEQIDLLHKQAQLWQSFMDRQK